MVNEESPAAVEFRTLVTLAEALEQDSRDGLPVVGLLDVLDEVTDRSCRELTAGGATLEAQAFARWRGVLASVRRAVESNRVRSVSGLVREARRLAMQLELALQLESAMRLEQLGRVGAPS